MSKAKDFISDFINRRMGNIKINFSWMFSYIKSNPAPLIIYTIIGLSGSVVSLLSSLVSKDMVDIITGHKTGELIMTFIMLIVTQILSMAITQASTLVSTKISIKIDNRIKADVYDKIMTTEWENLAQYNSGDLSARWSGDVSIVSNGMLTLIPNFLISLFHFAIALGTVIYYDATFAIFSLIGIPVSYLITRASFKRMQSSSMNTLAVSSRMSTFTYESFANLQTIKAFNIIKVYNKRLRELQSDVENVRLKYQRVSAINSIILTLVSLAITYSTYGWGVYRVWSGVITYGTMTMFLTLSSTLSSSIQTLINFVPNTISVYNAIRRVRSVSELPKEDFSHSDEALSFSSSHADDGVGIVVNDAAYTYPSGTEQVFTNACFEAQPHEIIALVGPSGEGKTTMMRLLLSIINSADGQAYLCPGGQPQHSDDNIPITASTRCLMSYVPQGNTMFAGTIADNMRNIKEDATDEEIIDALKLACAWDFVQKLPGGIYYELQERGGGLSEGQAQRLSIARALIKRSPILLLDEATSALDVFTEKELLENILEDSYPRTTILTTHRPSVLHSCNRVYSIHDKTCSLLSEEEIDEIINC